MSKEKETAIYTLDQVAIRMVREPPLISDTPVKTPEDAVRLCVKMLRDYDREVMCVINLSTTFKPINMSIVSIGILNGSLVHPREILKTAILSNAQGIIMLHNHPSGTLAPSREDIGVTRRMKEACDIIGIELVDHIITVPSMQYYSMKGEGDMPKQNILQWISAMERAETQYFPEVQHQKKRSVLSKLQERKTVKKRVGRTSLKYKERERQ